MTCIKPCPPQDVEIARTSVQATTMPPMRIEATNALPIAQHRPLPGAGQPSLTLSEMMTREPRQVSTDTPLGEAARLMADARISSVLVTQAGKPAGILTEHDMLRLLAVGTATDTPAGWVMSAPLATASPTETFADVWGRMVEQNLRHLVVVDEQDQLLGLVTETDFRNHLDASLLTEMGDLAHLMERELPELPPEANLNDALQLMLQRRSTYVLITQDHRALGILTERDIPRLMAHPHSETAASGPLLTVAHTPLHTVTQDTWMVEAVAQMQRLQVRHLAVVDGQGLLVGMVQMHTLMTHLGEQLQQKQAKRAHTELKQRSAQAEERLAMAAGAAQMGFWEINLLTGEMYLSSHTSQLVFMDLPGGKGHVKDFLERVDPADRVKIELVIEQTRQPGQNAPVDMEYRIRRGDGSVRWFHSLGQALDPDASGRHTRAMGVTMDITTRKLQQTQLTDTLNLLQQRQAELEHLSRTLDRSPVVAFTWGMTPEWPVEFVSANVRQWGHDPASFRSGKLSFEALIHPADRARVKAEITDHLQQHHESYNQTYRLQAAQGHWLWIEDHTWVERDARGHVRRLHGVLTDATARLWLERSSTIERKVLEQLAQGHGLSRLLNALARGYEQLMPGTACTVLLLDIQRQTLHEGAAPSLPAAYRQAIEGAAIGPAVGSCGTAAFTGQTVVVSDIASDPLWVNYKDVAQAHGLAACWSVPILGSQGQVVGTFALYTPQPQSPTPSELQAIERGAYLAGLAIDREHNQQALRKLSMAVEQSPNSIVITNLKAEIEYANQAFFAVTGFTPQEAMGKNPRILQSGKTPQSTYAQMWAHLSAGHPWKGEFINHRKDGTEYTESVRISPVQQPDGKVTHYLAIKEDITRHKQAEQQIYRLAYFDVLTGLPNRQLLSDRFQQAVNMVERHKQSLALMFIDLDHFKNINDTLGHSVGDELLVQVARRLESLVRAGDTLSRQGGDEFVLVLPGCGQEEARLVADKLVEHNNRSFCVGGHDVVVTLSIGIALYPSDGKDFEALSKSADVAMYQAKQSGRNTHRFFTPDMQSRSGRTLLLESSLRLAMDRGQLELVYQPQVSLARGQLVGLEALLRWRHPELGMVSPAEFIPLAEASGQILRIGEWVLRTAALQLKAWMDQGLDALVMAVNLSAVQFRDPGLAAMVAQVLRDTQLPPACLELELTESAAMGDPLGAVVAMDEISALQVSMSIDDFGTGYSSLSYLKRFKVGKLKIDQSFVRDITTDPDDKAIVGAIIGLASNLGLRTIAEGVETPGQLAWLRLQGCDEVQGYFFSPPLPPAELMTWVRTNGLHPGVSPL